MPGPGYYDSPREFETTRSVDFDEHTPDKRSQGSEAMPIEAWRAKFRGYTFNRSARDPKLNLNLPGPGDYSWRTSPRGGIAIGKSPKAAFARQRLSLPGPGYYDIRTERSHAPAYSIKGRPQTKLSSLPVKTTLGPREL
jgi:hypothetical protein